MATWGKRTLCMVTGASQGIGREIAVQFAQNMSPDSTIILSARSKMGLADTAHLILKVQPEIEVELFVYDMSKPKVEEFKSVLGNHSSPERDLYILVNNAATEGSCRHLKECENADEWQSYLSLNVGSMASLTSAFLKTFERDSKTIIVNITSIVVSTPFPGFGEYAVSKSAREMYMKSLAAEVPDLRVFNYAPGAVRTAMFEKCIEKLKNAESKEILEKIKKEDTFVKSEDSVKKLVSIIGAGLPPYLRVDYYDP